MLFSHALTVFSCYQSFGSKTATLTSDALSLAISIKNALNAATLISFNESKSLTLIWQGQADMLEYLRVFGSQCLFRFTAPFTNI